MSFFSKLKLFDWSGDLIIIWKFSIWEFSIILKGFTVSESPGLWQNMPKHPIGRSDSGHLKSNNEYMVSSGYS